MRNERNVGVIVGRFQPVTLEQIEALFKPALDENEVVVVILGSSDRARDNRDPFTAEERADMIKGSLLEFKLDFHRVMFRPVRDYWYNRTRWLKSVQDAASSGIKYYFGHDVRLTDCKVTLYGIDREDEQSEYLDAFPAWKSRVRVDPNIESNVMPMVYEDDSRWKDWVSNFSVRYISKWAKTEAGKNIVAGYEHIKRYRQKYDELERLAGHKIQFLTVDNVVLYNGHILLVRRRSHPGKGLWALPGGFLEADETALVGAKRELREETRVRVKDEWLKNEGRFDHPERSLRGRTLTHAFMWEIPSWRNVPQIGPDVGFEREVTKVQWFPLSEVLTDMANQLFEDHLDIIESLAY